MAQVALDHHAREVAQPVRVQPELACDVDDALPPLPTVHRLVVERVPDRQYQLQPPPSARERPRDALAEPGEPVAPVVERAPVEAGFREPEHESDTVEITTRTADVVDRDMVDALFDSVSRVFLDFTTTKASDLALEICRTVGGVEALSIVEQKIRTHNSKILDELKFTVERDLKAAWS